MVDQTVVEVVSTKEEEVNRVTKMRIDNFGQNVKGRVRYCCKFQFQSDNIARRKRT